MGVMIAAMLLAAAQATAACPAVPDGTLTLGEAAFDQDGEKGWRPLAKPGCFLKAADLIAAWRTRHPVHGNVVVFHEAQMRAAGGDYREAGDLFAQARAAPNALRVDYGWNAYVAASVAFVRRDLAALKAARATLASLPPPAEQPGVAAAVKAEPRPEEWPPNLAVVDGLIACFDKSYADAMNPACRPPAGR